MFVEVFGFSWCKIYAIKTIQCYCIILLGTSFELGEVFLGRIEGIIFDDIKCKLTHRHTNHGVVFLEKNQNRLVLKPSRDDGFDIFFVEKWLSSFIRKIFTYLVVSDVESLD